MITNMKEKQKYRKSKQRDTILDLLMGRKDHPTADVLYMDLKQDFPDLSLGNVYRNLNILVDQKIIQRLDFGSTFNRFDGNSEPHSHFICTECSSVSDVDLAYQLNFDIVADPDILNNIESFKLDFFGKCSLCS